MAFNIEKYLDRYDTKTLNSVKCMLQATAKHDINIYEVFDIIENMELQRYKAQAKMQYEKRRQDMLQKRRSKLQKERTYKSKAELRRQTQRRSTRATNERGILKKLQDKREEERAKQQELPPIHNCERCGGVVRGMLVPFCEWTKSGRRFYRECDNCEYYCETLYIDGKVSYREQGD